MKLTLTEKSRFRKFGCPFVTYSHVGILTKYLYVSAPCVKFRPVTFILSMSDDSGTSEDDDR